jgi:hypothetical protein
VPRAGAAPGQLAGGSDVQPAGRSLAAGGTGPQGSLTFPRSTICSSPARWPLTDCQICLLIRYSQDLSPDRPISVLTYVVTDET